MLKVFFIVFFLIAYLFFSSFFCFLELTSLYLPPIAIITKLVNGFLELGELA